MRKSSLSTNAAVNTQTSINLIREIINDDAGLERHGAWLRRCLADYLSSEGKKLEICFGIPRNWRDKERKQKRNQAIRELTNTFSIKGNTNKSIYLNELIDNYLIGDYRNDYIYGLPRDADEQRRLLFDIVKNVGILSQRRIEQILTKFK